MGCLMPAFNVSWEGIHLIADAEVAGAVGGFTAAQRPAAGLAHQHATQGESEAFDQLRAFAPDRPWPELAADLVRPTAASEIFAVIGRWKAILTHGGVPGLADFAMGLPRSERLEIAGNPATPPSLRRVLSDDEERIRHGSLAVTSWPASGQLRHRVVLLSSRWPASEAADRAQQLWEMAVRGTAIHLVVVEPDTDVVRQAQPIIIEIASANAYWGAPADALPQLSIVADGDATLRAIEHGFVQAPSGLAAAWLQPGSPIVVAGVNQPFGGLDLDALRRPGDALDRLRSLLLPTPYGGGAWPGFPQAAPQRTVQRPELN